jgi:hypothetical protein
MFMISLLSWSLGAADAGAPGRATPPPRPRPDKSPALSNWREEARRSATEQDGSKDDWERLLANAQADYINALENNEQDQAALAHKRIIFITTKLDAFGSSMPEE